MKTTATSRDELSEACLLLLAAWALLLCRPLLAGVLDEDAALFAVFLAITALLLATRPAPVPGRRCPLLLGALGVLAGIASFPGWVVLVAALGVAIGLEPRPLAPPAEGLLRWTALGVLGPVFEELLYRERLLAPLADRVGGIGAVILTSALFAASHLEPWSVLATCCVGLALGATMRAGGSIALCIGFHGGLNAGSLLSGSSPMRDALPTLTGVGIAGALLGIGIAMARAGSPKPLPGSARPS